MLLELCAKLHDALECIMVSSYTGAKEVDGKQGILVGANWMNSSEDELGNIFIPPMFKSYVMRECS